MSAGGSLRKTVSKAQDGMTNASQRNDALTRIQMLEAKFSILTQQLQGVLKSQDEKMDNLARVLNAIGNILGMDTVMAEVRKQRLDELEAQAKATDDQVQAELAQGNLVVAETADSDDFLVVTTQKAADGTPLYPTRVHLPLEGYAPDVKPLLTGKKVGDVITLPNETTVTVLEIYKPVVKTEPDAPSESQPVATPEGSSDTAGA